MSISFFPKTPQFLDMFLRQNDLITNASSALFDLFKYINTKAEKCTIISVL
jgi:hypothetical protein